MTKLFCHGSGKFRQENNYKRKIAQTRHARRAVEGFKAAVARRDLLRVSLFDFHVLCTRKASSKAPLIRAVKAVIFKRRAHQKRDWNASHLVKFWVHEILPVRR